MVDWKELRDQIVLARESSLMNQYDSSEIYYQAAIGAIRQQVLPSIPPQDHERISGWKEV